jgi:hypothetical protein
MISSSQGVNPCGIIGYWGVKELYHHHYKLQQTLKTQRDKKE